MDDQEKIRPEDLEEEAPATITLVDEDGKEFEFDILASYGIIVFVMVCIFLYGVMRRKQERKQSYTQTIALVGFICALLLGIGEAALFSGGLSVYLYFGIFLLTNNEPQGIGESCEDRICK